jgi:hypothetical protein
MTRLQEPSPEEEKAYKRWLRSRPKGVRKVAARIDPWTLYRLKTTGQRVTIYSFSEQKDGAVTLTVSVTGQFNPVVFDKNVFGISPDDLEPCEPPAPNELVGTLFTDDNEVEAYIDLIRPSVLAARAKAESEEA